EFVKGRTLRGVIEQDRPPAQRVLEIMRQVASGLEAIHAMGMLHRDLSPNNIMVLDDGTAKILDLGLAKNVGVQSSVASAGALAALLSRQDVRAVPAPSGESRLGPRETPRNPYLNRTMLKHRDDFFGRGPEIKRIFARLNATPPGSISVVGDRKIGKSSLLN